MVKIPRKRVTRSLIMVLIALVAAEILFGQWLPPNFGSLQARRDERRYYDVTGMFPGAGISLLKTDSYGFRGDYGGDPSAIDLLLIGNSTTREEYVSEGETWADRLRRHFRDGGTPLNIAVAANHGMTARGLLRRFDDWFAAVPGLRARYVLVYTGSNELYPENEKKYDRMAPEPGLRRFVEYVKNASTVYATYHRLRGALRGPSQATKVGSGTPYVAPTWRPAGAPAPLAAPDKDLAARLSAYEMRIRSLVRRIRDFGAIPIIANQHVGFYRIVAGTVYGPPASNPAATLRNYGVARAVGAAAMRACRDAGAICIDTLSGFDYDDPADLYDHVHTTPIGDRKLAAFFYARLKSVVAARR